MLHRAEQALADGDPARRLEARTAVDRRDFTIVLRGYDRGQVDARLAELAGQLGS